MALIDPLVGGRLCAEGNPDEMGDKKQAHWQSADIYINDLSATGLTTFFGFGIVAKKLIDEI